MADYAKRQVSGITASKLGAISNEKSLMFWLWKLKEKGVLISSKILTKLTNETQLAETWFVLNLGNFQRPLLAKMSTLLVLTKEGVRNHYILYIVFCILYSGVQEFSLLVRTKGVHSLVTQSRLEFKSWGDYSGVFGMVRNSIANVCIRV